MKTRSIAASDFLYMIPVSLTLGTWLAFIQGGNRLIGLISFFFIFLLSYTLLKLSYHWAGSRRILGIIMTVAFGLRLMAGVSLYLGLPSYGHDDIDDQSGFVFTDAHRRDEQAWDLASSERPLLTAFTDRFAYDQYGGLLAFSALAYRYLSPDAHRPLMLVVFSALVAALGIPFFWRSAKQIFGEKVALASAWIFALYPESILLGSSAMREPYLLMFSAFAFWGFTEWQAPAATLAPGARAGESPKEDHSRGAWVWLGTGLLGLLLVSPVIALVTLVIFAGWMFFADERRNLSWRMIFAFAVVFLAGLFFLSASLNRAGQFDATSPFHVINDWLRLAVKWDAYQLEEGSGWVQKLFDEGPPWIRLPFITIYGIFQPVLPAALVVPTKLIWKVIYLLRALGWYAILPMLTLSFIAGSGLGRRAPASEGASVEASGKRRKLLTWLSLLTWAWILFSALRAGGDLWDNPRYRTILFLWQALIVGYVWVWWRETRNVWLARTIACEAAFLAIFTQWYASRYFHWGGQLPFAVMLSLILGLWGIILGGGWWRDRSRA